MLCVVFFWTCMVVWDFKSVFSMSFGPVRNIWWYVHTYNTLSKCIIITSVMWPGKLLLLSWMDPFYSSFACIYVLMNTTRKQGPGAHFPYDSDHIRPTYLITVSPEPLAISFNSCNGTTKRLKVIWASSAFQCLQAWPSMVSCTVWDR